jgi:hypothetical protein
LATNLSFGEYSTNSNGPVHTGLSAGSVPGAMMLKFGWAMISGSRRLGWVGVMSTVKSSITFTESGPTKLVRPSCLSTIRAKE